MTTPPMPPNSDAGSPLPPPEWPEGQPTGQPGVRSMRPSRARRYTLIGLSAGLLGGAAVGLAVTTPSLGQAADDLPQLIAADDTVPDDGSTDPATSVPSSTPVPVPDSNADQAGEPGDWIREALQPLVDDGTLTSDELETIVQDLLAARPDAGPGGWPGGMGPMGPMGPGHMGHIGHGGFVRQVFDRQTLADALGITPEVLASELQSGKTLAEIGEENGVATDDLIQALVQDAQDQLDQAVADGDLTDEQAADLEATVTERVTDLVNRQLTMPPGGDWDGDRPGRPGGHDDAPAGTHDAPDTSAPLVVPSTGPGA